MPVLSKTALNDAYKANSHVSSNISCIKLSYFHYCMDYWNILADFIEKYW